MPQPAKGQLPDTGGAEAQPTNVVLVDIGETVDPLAKFQSEADAAWAEPSTRNAKRTLPSSKRVIIGGSAIVATAIAFAIAFSLKGRVTLVAAPKAATRTGRAAVTSRPAGAAVLIDGVARGVTPLDIELAVGTHDLVLRSAAGERQLALTIDNVVRLVENVDMPTAAPTTGEVDVTSDPLPARVFVDGTPAGQTPLHVRELSVGRHEIALIQGATTVNRTVNITAGATATVFASLAEPHGSGVTGTFAIESPVELRVFESGQLLGVSDAVPLTVGAGKHRFELVNDALELRLVREVTIESGKPTRVSVSIPNGTIFMNASPWAEVLLDGKSVGVTPLGNVSVPAGTHDVVFRHPQLGERSRSVTVGARTPVRIAVDMRK